MTHANPADRDLLETWLGINPDSPLGQLRAVRPTARTQTQLSHDLLLDPARVAADSLQHFSLTERWALAWFTALLHRQPAAIHHYHQGLQQQAAIHPDAGVLLDLLPALAEQASDKGPWGHYLAGPLSAEDVPGQAWTPDAATTAQLGVRLSAALAHVHLLVFHPRDASAKALQRLQDAGWSSTGIVSLSQLVAFLAYQLRVASGLQVLQQVIETSPATPA